VIADTVAAVLVLVAIAYAALAGADFGGGIWDLLAGSTARGREPRRRIDHSITPVWESNHVWLIILVVVLWTGFPVAFGWIFTTLFVPLSVAALGIVLRGAGFAFRPEVRAMRWEPVAGAVFAFASMLTPFFLGTAVGAVVTGQVQSGNGDPAAAWVNPTSLLTGALFVAFSAYLAAVYLAADSERGGEPELRRYFTRRAFAAGVVSGVLAAVTMAVLRTSAHRIFTNLTAGRSLPLVVVSVLAGVAVLVLLALDRVRLIRPLAAVAVAAVAAGWAIAQYPELLPPRLTIADAAAPTAALGAELLVVFIIVVVVGPSFALLFWLTQRGHLGETEVTSASMLILDGDRPGSAVASAPPDPAAGRPPGRPAGLALAAVIALVAARRIQRRRRDRASVRT
jgi:cytochrome d ubiquinol oxidase subunit II